MDTSNKNVSNKDVDTFLEFLINCSKGAYLKDPVKWFDYEEEPMPKPLEMWYKMHPTITIPKSN